MMSFCRIVSRRAFINGTTVSTNTLSGARRLMCSQGDKAGMAARKPARAARKAKPVRKAAGVMRWVVLGAITAPVIGWQFLGEDDKKTASDAAFASPLGGALRWVGVQIDEICRPFTDPSQEKLLPDWPVPGVPPDMPCPLTLVLDLEDTLVHSEWDRKHGWRHAKRPGVDKFINTVARYYEVVVFTSNINGVADPVISALDKQGYIMHRLFRDSTLYMNGTHVKDLSRLNRDLKKVILIDDDPAAFQLQPGNAIRIKAFTDGSDKTDSSLEDLLPFLEGIVRERVTDVPALLKQYEGEDIPSTYAAKMSAIREKRAKESKMGLGGLVRGRGATIAPPPGAAGKKGSLAADPFSLRK